MKTSTLHALRNLRLRFGLRWQSAYPRTTDFRNARRDALLLIFIAALWAWSMHRDWLEEQAAEQVKTEARAAAYQKLVFDCMTASAQGRGMGFIYMDTVTAFDCQIREIKI